MVFSTTNLFKDIQCPYGEECALTNCIFNHDPRPKPVQPSETSTVQSIRTRNLESKDPAAKRRKITYNTLSEKPPSKADQIKADLAAAKAASAAPTEKKYSPNDAGLAVNGSQSQPGSLTRPISPPPSYGKAALKQTTNTQPDNSKLDKNQTRTLNPPSKLEHDHPEQLNPQTHS